MRKVGLLMLILLICVSTVSAQENQAQANKATIYQFIEALDAADFSTVASLYAEDFTNQSGESRDDMIASFEASRDAFSDLQYTPTVVIAQNDLVAWHLIITGNFENDYAATPEFIIPATGQPINFSMLGFARFNEAGQIVQEWLYQDATTVMTQLGLIPTENTDDISEDSLTDPVGYELLSEAELAETFRSGMETRNIDLFQSQIDEMAMGTTDYYADPFIARQAGITTLTTPEPVGSADFLSLAMPDLTIGIELQVAEGDWVAAVATFHGTFTDEVAMGEMTLIPTGEQITWQIAAIERYDTNGLIVEEWTEGDLTTVAIELGLIPPLDE